MKQETKDNIQKLKEKGMGNAWRIDNLLPIVFLKIIPIKLGCRNK